MRKNTDFKNHPDKCSFIKDKWNLHEKENLQKIQNIHWLLHERPESKQPALVLQTVVPSSKK